jgi:hypothetical protein
VGSADPVDFGVDGPADVGVDAGGDAEQAARANAQPTTRPVNAIARVRPADDRAVTIVGDFTSPAYSGPLRRRPVRATRFVQARFVQPGRCVVERRLRETDVVTDSATLLQRGRALEWTTLGWNVIGVAVLAYLAISSSSVALAGFGLDSFIEIGASTVVLWELSGTGVLRQKRALRAIGVAFVALAAYLLVQSTVALAFQHRPTPGVGGVVWTGATAILMFVLAAGKARVGRAVGNPVLEAEGRVTFVDGLLAVAVLLGVTMDLLFGWWWADAVTTYVLVFYAAREAVQIFRE